MPSLKLIHLCRELGSLLGFAFRRRIRTRYVAAAVALSGSTAISCPPGQVPTNTGGCYTLPAAQVGRCPNIPPTGYTYASGSCRVVPLPWPMGPATPGAPAAAPAAPAAPAPQPAAPAPQPAAPAQQPSQPGSGSSHSAAAAGSSQVANDTSCGTPIIFNCAKGYMTFGNDGPHSTIACGDDTKNDSGTIGDPAKGAGSVFASMKGADIVLLNPPPCGNCVVHGIPPQNPTNVIAGSSSHGCIHINPPQLKLLQTCKGVAFQVISTNAGTASGAGRSGGKGTTK